MEQLLSLWVYRMKKIYKLLISAILLIFMVFSSSIGAEINLLSPAIKAIAMLAFVIPALLLLYLVSRDAEINKKWRTVARIGMVFLLIAYLSVVFRKHRLSGSRTVLRYTL